MRPTTTAKTGSGSTAWVPLDTHKNPFNVSLAVVVSGTVNYTVELTYDNIQDSAVTPTAFAHGTLAAQTANATGTITAPVRAIRLTVNSGSGTATLTIQQAG